MTTPVEFIIIVEEGYLERQTKLLVYTLRNFGGKYAKSKIVAYQPRKKYPVSESTLKFFDTYEVEFVDHYLNKKYATFAYGNKPIILEYHERNAGNKSLIYLDCDLFFFNEPTEFGKVGINEIATRPEDAKGAGTLYDFDDENGHYWKKAYELLQIKPNRDPAFTILDFQRVQPYFNSGLFEIRSETGFMQQWLENMERLLKMKALPREQLVMSEQMAFSLTISQMQLGVKNWEVGYNFPTNLFFYNDIKNPAYQEAIFKEQCVFHYHKIFTRPDEKWRKFLNDSSKGKDILEKISAFELNAKTSSPISIRIRRRLDSFLFKNKYSS